MDMGFNYQKRQSLNKFPFSHSSRYILALQMAFKKNPLTLHFKSGPWVPGLNVANSHPGSYMTPPKKKEEAAELLDKPQAPSAGVCRPLLCQIAKEWFTSYRARPCQRSVPSASLHANNPPWATTPHTEQNDFCPRTMLPHLILFYQDVGKHLFLIPYFCFRGIHSPRDSKALKFFPRKDFCPLSGHDFIQSNSSNSGMCTRGRGKGRLQDARLSRLTIEKNLWDLCFWRRTCAP